MPQTVPSTEQVLRDGCRHEYRKKALALPWEHPPGVCPALAVQDKAWRDARALWLSLKRNKTKNYFLPADPKPPQLTARTSQACGGARAACQADSLS